MDIEHRPTPACNAPAICSMSRTTRSPRSGARRRPEPYPPAAPLPRRVRPESRRVPRAEKTGDAQARAARQRRCHPRRVRGRLWIAAAACTKPAPRGWACCPAPTAAAARACKSIGRSSRPSSAWRWWRRPNAACVRSRSATTRAKLEAELRGEFPNAEIARVQDGRDEFLGAARAAGGRRCCADNRGTLDIELIGTAFQQRVWEALMKIPRGQTLQLRAVGAVARPAQRRARRGPRLRPEPAGRDRALPSHHPRRRLPGWLSLGPAAQGRASVTPSRRRRRIAVAATASNAIPRGSSQVKPFSRPCLPAHAASPAGAARPVAGLPALGFDLPGDPLRAGGTIRRSCWRGPLFVAGGLMYAVLRWRGVPPPSARSGARCRAGIGWCCCRMAW